MKRSLRIAFLSIAVLLVQGTWALAGVTGTANGTVQIEGTNAPVAQAKVTASSASQTSTATTDNAGHFGFVSLVPDTYTFTASKDGVIETVVQRGVTVQADQVATVVLVARPYIKTLAAITSRASSDLVRPGTTADVYSVNAAGQARTAMLGGGGGADQGYSALAALPGAYVPPGQMGWFQTVYIRGGDFDQVGYEFDGVPVNRSFDNYPTSSLSALGQQELQLYTGGSPAGAEATGLAGYINQVIKSGTYPGFGTINLGIGAPSLYNKANIEFGGATPNRNFSYYVGLGVVNSAPRIIDNSNGAGYTQTAGSPFDIQCPPGAANPSDFAGCYGNTAYFGALPVGPGGYVLGPTSLWTALETLKDRENVFNFHIGIPHKNDGGKDDIQLLYQTYLLNQYFAGSINDWGGPGFYNANDANGCFDCPGTVFTSARQWVGPLGALFTSADPSQAANVVNYAFPAQGAIGLGGPIGLSTRDTFDNGQAIYKLQWQHNIGTSSYFRLYGYVFYSWWYLYGANTTQAAFGGCCPPDYELTAHTRGTSAQYMNQLSSKHLLNAEASYSTSDTVRANNTQPTQCFGPASTGCGGQRTRFGFLVDSLNPNDGICYNSAHPGVAYSCEPSNPSSVRPSILTYAGSGAGGVQATGIPAPGSTCGASGTDPCAWSIAENGPWATFNSVAPRFWAVSLQDTWKPNDKLNINFGVRDDVFTFGFAPTGGGTRDFWFNAWNITNCVNAALPGTSPFDETNASAAGPVNGLPNVPAGTPCSVFGANYVNATITNSTANGGSQTYNEIQPRIAGTYTLGINDVLRASYGRYTEAPQAAFQQYNSLDQNLPNHLLGSLFFRAGWTTPNHYVAPSISNNYDISYEHRLANSQTSFKLTPFYRNTQNQIVNFYIDPKTAFASGVNAGNETNTGLEFMLSMGSFNSNGWASQLSYTYTHSYIKYGRLPNGSSVLTSDNFDIQHYNSFTSACAGAAPSTNPTSLCGIAGSANAVATETSGVANPYFNAPAQPLLDLNGTYAPYSIVPAGVQLSSQGYITPNVAVLVVQYKHDKWSFVPGLQFHSGQVYGAPETTYGFDPATCAALAGSVAGDPRYPFGGSGLPADATSCSPTGISNGSLVIPDPLTGKFDSIGAFVQPSQFSMGMGIGYDASSRVSYTIGLTSIINTCFGGSKEPWTTNDHHVCGYGVRAFNTAPVGNFYNPGSAIQPFAKYPYMQFASTNGLIGYTNPFAATFNVSAKI